MERGRDAKCAALVLFYIYTLFISSLVTRLLLSRDYALTVVALASPAFIGITLGMLNLYGGGDCDGVRAFVALGLFSTLIYVVPAVAYATLNWAQVWSLLQKNVANLVFTRRAQFLLFVSVLLQTYSAWLITRGKFNSAIASFLGSLILAYVWTLI